MAEVNKELPFISIVVLSYNQAAYIRDCIESVLSLQYEGRLEYIFCDDCSTDDTFDIICQATAHYKGPHRIICHKCPTNGRVAVNMNTAVSLSSGDWIMRVDGDDIVHPERLKLTAHAIRKFPQAVAISGQLHLFEGQTKPIANPQIGELEYLVANRQENNAANAPMRAMSWWGGAMTMARRVFTAFPPIPSDCGIMDDTFFGARSLLLGDFVIIRNACFLYYRRHENNISSIAISNTSLRGYMRADAESRNYYKRCMPCHSSILAEIEQYTATHPDCEPVLEFFRTHLAERERQALFWEKSWKERIADAHIKGAWWRKIPWALRTLCPFTWALARKLGKR